MKSNSVQPAFELLAHAGRRQYHFKSGYPIHDRDYLDGVSVDYIELRTTVTTQEECGKLIAYLMVAVYCLPIKIFGTLPERSECRIKTDKGIIIGQDYPLAANTAASMPKYPWYKIETRLRARRQGENLITWLIQHLNNLPSISAKPAIDYEKPAVYDSPPLPANFKGDEHTPFNFKSEWTTGPGLEELGKTPEDPPPQ